MFDTPKHGWTCFHCNETFTERWSAYNHFGGDEGKSPACQIKSGERGLVETIRELELEVARAYAALHEENGDAVKAMHGMVARHQTALRQIEELGYERGLADGRKLGADAT